MKIALCFRFAQLFWLSKLSRGAISSNYGKKFKGLKRNKQGYTEGTFHYRDKFPLRDLVQGQAPRNPKSTMNSLRSCFLKAKAHDSKNHLAANIFKSGFSEGEESNFHNFARRHSLISFLWILERAKQNECLRVITRYSNQESFYLWLQAPI